MEGMPPMSSSEDEMDIILIIIIINIIWIIIWLGDTVSHLVKCYTNTKMQASQNVLYEFPAGKVRHIHSFKI